jgi:hypothetical protein
MNFTLCLFFIRLAQKLAFACGSKGKSVIVQQLIHRLTQLADVGEGAVD